MTPGVVDTPLFTREDSFFHNKDEEASKFLKEQAVAHPLGRVGQPQDVTESIAYLASDAASFVTGQLIFIDGGRHLV
ncbi:tropinone reductase 1-like [Haliotis rufescens]|uniref:tropinone reductase 1-like n=1 Tax=Haliotis rufescens TaxID=6454 RepID=UPI00201E8C97|nr:tropinone reductase 1-like [Haliotis rufescens]